METSYLKLMEGNRLKNYVGLEMQEGHAFHNGIGYLYLDIPVLGVDTEEGRTQEIKRNQHVFIKAAATVNVRGYSFIEIEPNSDLAEVGSIQGLYRVHPGTGQQQVGFWFTARKDVNLAEFKYLARIYMVN